MSPKKRDLFAGDIQLNEEDHTYHVKEYPHLKWTSATNFIGEYFEPFNTEKIAGELADSSNRKYGHMSKEEVLQQWEDFANTGTAIHKEVENWVKEVIMGDKEEIPIQYDKTQHGVDWLNENIESYFKLYPEVKIYSLPLQLAGTIDLLIYNPKVDKWVMIDWKTNTKIRTSSYKNKKGLKNATKYLDSCNYNKYQLQMSLYQWILKEEYGVDVLKRGLIHLRPKKTRYYPLGVKEYWTDYLYNNIEMMVEDRVEQRNEGKLFNPLPVRN